MLLNLVQIKKVIVEADSKSIKLFQRNALKNDLSFYTDAFYQEKRSSGFGLGLYICKNYCKLV